MKLVLEAEPLGVVVVARCDLRMDGCTATEPSPVTIVRVGAQQDQFVVCRACLEKMIQEGEWSVRGARINAPVDFVLKDSLERSMVAIEVKSMPRTRALNIERWGSSIRRNLAVHTALPGFPYFLLVLVPEVGLLWSNPDSEYGDAPDYNFDLKELELEDDPVPLEDGQGAQEWAARALDALLTGKLHPSGLWWTQSGLGKAIEGGRMKRLPA